MRPITANRYWLFEGLNMKTRSHINTTYDSGISQPECVFNACAKRLYYFFLSNHIQRAFPSHLIQVATLHLRQYLTHSTKTKLRIATVIQNYKNLWNRPSSCRALKHAKTF